MSTKKKDVPHAGLILECPVKGVPAHVDIALNIFRERGVLTGCDHLDKGEVCGQGCMVTKKTRKAITQIITAEQLKHAQDLGTVGPNVVG